MLDGSTLPGGIPYESGRSRDRHHEGREGIVSSSVRPRSRDFITERRREKEVVPAALLDEILLGRYIEREIPVDINQLGEE